jgi:hypothetical protein
MKALYPTIALLCFLLLVHGMERQRRDLNVAMKRMDQSAYMENARRMAQTHFRFKGDRARMPLLPAMMAPFYHDGMSDESLFEIGKRMGEVIAVLVLVAFFCVLRVYAPTPDALAATAVAALTVFAYKAPYVRADVLYYGIGLAFFALTIELLARPRLWVAAVAGLAAGLAYLAKSSVPPAIALCVVFLTARTIRNLYVRFRSPRGENSPTRLSWLSATAPLYCALVFALVFLLTLFIYIRDTKAIYGRYFYDVSSTFYMWYDSWEEAEAGTKAHGDRRGWPDMPDSEIPTMGKYFREHSPRQVVDRLARGTRFIWRRTWNSYGYMPFVSFYLFCVLAIAARNAREFRRWAISGDNAMLALFTTMFFAGYFLAYAWYASIAAGNRFVLALFLPAMYMFVRFIALARKADWPLLRIAGKRIPASAVSPAVLIMLLAYAIFVFPHRVSTMYGGQ